VNEKKTNRLDRALVERKIILTRSQAESFIRLGLIKVEGKIVRKPGYPVSHSSRLELTAKEQYVSRAGLKLASVAEEFGLDFRGKSVLDVGSSTGGFTDFALQNGASKVIAVDVGTNQLHHSLRLDQRVELHEQTDIRDLTRLSQPVDYVVIDVSFISLRDVLPAVGKLAKQAKIIAMVKPQFEAGRSNLKHKGVIKNEKMRREILRDFETWVKNYYKVINKADSQVAGEKGNKERFYFLSNLPEKSG